MLILEQKVKIKWNNANRKYYESKGYLFTKNGEEFSIDIEDISKGSKALVKFKCDWVECNSLPFERPFHLAMRNEHQYCCHDCSVKSNSKRKLDARPVKNCEWCQKEYSVPHFEKETSRFCSRECKTKWNSVAFKGNKSSRYVERITVECSWCGEDIQRTPNYINNRTYNFCNRDCQQNWHREVYVKSDEFLELAKKTMLNNLREGKIRTSKTEPHLKINQILDDLGVKYENELPVSDYSFDIYLSDFDLYIEVNGGYWHCDNRLYKEINYAHQLDRIIKDKRKRTYLLNNLKKRILYLWEYDIDNNLDGCVNLVIEFIKNKGILQNYHSMNYHLESDTLRINQNLIIPYMEKSFTEIGDIVNLEVRKKVTRYDDTKHITFNCEYCGNEKTQPITVFMKAKNHFCSVKCKNLSQQIGNNTNQLKFVHQCGNCTTDLEVQNHIHLKLTNGEQKNIFCSYECKYEWESKNRTGKNNPLYNRIEKKCKYCEQPYEVPPNQLDRSHYCSVECRQKGSRNRIIVNCLNCGEDVYKTPTDIKKNKTGKYFCSHDCHIDYKVKSNREIRVCEYEICGNSFETKKISNQRFCSISCRNKGVALLNKSSN